MATSGVASFHDGGTWRRDPRNSNVWLLPENPLVMVRGRGETQLTVKRRDDLAIVTSVTIYNDGKNQAWAKFSSTTGRLIELSFTRDGWRMREWGFREDGTLKYETVFERGPSKSSQKGTRTYYDREGKPARTEHHVIHQCS